MRTLSLDVIWQDYTVIVNVYHCLIPFRFTLVDIAHKQVPRKWNILYQWINSLCFLSAASVRNWNIFYTNKLPSFVFKVEIASALFRMWNMFHTDELPPCFLNAIYESWNCFCLVRKWTIFHTNEFDLYTNIWKLQPLP